MDLALDDIDRKIYEWQIWVDGFGEAGQKRLKNSTVLISRCGGLGGVVAWELAAAGVGKLILAHGGNLRLDDLNRQILMSYERVDLPRAQTMEETLKRFNPRIQVQALDTNIQSNNIEALVCLSDAVVSAAPLFEERFLMNDACVRNNKIFVDASMYNLEAQLMSYASAKDPCLRCLYPQAPKIWRREFPVFGAVSASVGAMAAMEILKLLCNLGVPLRSKMLRYNLENMSFKVITTKKNMNCPTCSKH